ncbi:hypothetical protein AB0E69_33330 [Kribbella sp. NPDC026611]|uniref:hypothetical protein n=1 Tax=Kribbella sp. NPDC026611 TaxID=3154911 RepID=UPI0033CA5A67
MVFIGFTAHDKRFLWPFTSAVLLFSLNAVTTGQANRDRSAGTHAPAGDRLFERCGDRINPRTPRHPDLNAAPQAASIRYLSGLQTLNGQSVHYHDAWAVAGDGPGLTWSAANPLAATEIDAIVGQPGHSRRIDYVFVGSAHAHPDARSRIMAAQLIGDSPVDHTWLNDHTGVMVDLDAEITASS